VADTEIAWRGVTLGGSGDFRVLKVTGWDDQPPVTDYSQERTRGHGDHVGELFARARTVTVTGEIVDTVNRDTLARRLQAVSTVDSVLRDLTVTMFGLTLTAQARVVARALDLTALYDVGNVPFSLQWRCPDPLRYGAAVNPSTPLPLAGGGLAYPLAYPLPYGDPGITGRIPLTNPGTAPATLLLDIRGGLPEGWLVSAAGQALAYPVAVPSGQTIEVDTGAGTVLVEGTASRRGNLTRADWLTVPAADPETGQPGQLELQFASLGGARDPNAQLSALMRPAYW